MAKAILDIYIEQGYPYPFNLDMNDADGVDLEADYSCYFYCVTIGVLPFSVVGNRYELVISGINTAKVISNLDEYVVYTVKTSDSSEDKLLSGRIHSDAKVRP
jgi:hypothetical protein